MKQIEFSKLKSADMVTILHMDDYFGEDQGPYADKMMSVKDFRDNVLQELIDDGIDQDEAFDEWNGASGDGSENFVLLALRNGQIYTVVPDEQ